MSNENGDNKKLVNSKQVGEGIVPHALSEDVFFIIVDGFSKYESQTKICEKAGIQRFTLRQWLSDPNPVGIVKELQEAIKELQVTPQRLLYLKTQEVLMKRLTEPRVTVRETKISANSITTQEYNQIKNKFGEEAADTYRAIVERCVPTVVVKKTTIREEISAMEAFKIWSYLREELGNVSFSGEDDIVLSVIHPDCPEV